MKFILFIFLLQKTVPPDIDGELKPGVEGVPFARRTVCLVNSWAPIDSGIDCLKKEERKFCEDMTTNIFEDELKDTMKRYSGSYFGSCRKEDK